jgi:hypothetical protein
VDEGVHSEKVLRRKGYPIIMGKMDLVECVEGRFHIPDRKVGCYTMTGKNGPLQDQDKWSKRANQYFRLGFDRLLYNVSDLGSGHLQWKGRLHQ